MNFGPAIRKIRERRGLSLRDLATKSGVEFSYIGKIERGVRIPPLEILHTLSNSLEVPFHLLALMAASSKELKGITPEIAQELSDEMLTSLESITQHARP